LPAALPPHVRDRHHTIVRCCARAAPGPLATRRARLAGLLAAFALLAACALASLAFGSLAVPFAEVIRAFTAYDGSDAHAIVRDLRVPRTELGIPRCSCSTPRRSTSSASGSSARSLAATPA
jgi:hypothetical protein